MAKRNSFEKGPSVKRSKRFAILDRGISMILKKHLVFFHPNVLNGLVKQRMIQQETTSRHK